VGDNNIAPSSLFPFVEVTINPSLINAATLLTMKQRHFGARQHQGEEEQ
jgi:hypothetical protein